MANKKFKYDREKVAKLFAHNKTNVLLLTSDGQVFLEKNKTFCVNHAKSTNSDWMTLTKEEFDADGKEASKGGKSDKGSNAGAGSSAGKELTPEEKIAAATAEVEKRKGILADKEAALEKAEGSKKGLATTAVNKAKTALEEAEKALAELAPEGTGAAATNPGSEQ